MAPLATRKRWSVRTDCLIVLPRPFLPPRTPSLDLLAVTRPKFVLGHSACCRKCRTKRGRRMTLALSPIALWVYSYCNRLGVWNPKQNIHSARSKVTRHYKLTKPLLWHLLPLIKVSFDPQFQKLFDLTRRFSLAFKVLVQEISKEKKDSSCALKGFLQSLSLQIKDWGLLRHQDPL